MEHTDLLRALKKKQPRVKLVGKFRRVPKLRFKCYVCLGTWKIAPQSAVSDGCPYCSGRVKFTKKTRPRFTTVSFDGRDVRLQGYEPKALAWIQTRFPKLTDILFDSEGEVPVIEYKVNRRTRQFYPDMYVPSQRRIIEVKSTYTLGLDTGRHWKRNQEKARACIEAGYEFVLLCMRGNGERVILPRDWYDLPRKQVLSIVQGEE